MIATTFNVDTANLKAMMEALHDAMVGRGEDVSSLVQDETKRLSKTVSNLAPPIRSKWGNAKTSGEMAVQRELNNLISAASDSLIDEIGSEHGIKNIKTARAGKNGEPIDIKWENLDPTGARLDVLHKSFRNKRGKIPLRRKSPGKWDARIVTTFAAKKAHIDKIKSRVGMMKATMVLAAARLGEKVPTWISRHFGSAFNARFSILDLSQLNNPEYPVSVFGSRAPGIAERVREKDRLRDAINLRARAIRTRTKLMLSGYSNWREVRRRTQAGLSYGKLKNFEPEQPFD